MALRLAMLGLDTSHAPEFTARLHSAAHPEHVPGARVVKAMPAASPDIPLSTDRVLGFTTQLRDDLGVAIVEDWDTLLRDIDGLLILSLDGRPHLQQVERALRARVPVFLDKPVAASWDEVQRIYQLAERSGVPLFSASALRFHPQVQSHCGASSAIVSGPCPGLEHHPELYFYGIHPTEALFTVMGNDCLSVQAERQGQQIVITGNWSHGRIGVLRGTPEHGLPYEISTAGRDTSTITSCFYGPLLQAIVRFVETKQSPIAAADTLAIYRFMTAANLSLEDSEPGGKPIRFLRY
jgi:hypothetical protein